MFSKNHFDLKTTFIAHCDVQVWLGGWLLVDIKEKRLSESESMLTPHVCLLIALLLFIIYVFLISRHCGWFMHTYDYNGNQSCDLENTIFRFGVVNIFFLCVLYMLLSSKCFFFSLDKMNKQLLERKNQMERADLQSI